MRRRRQRQRQRNSGDELVKQINSYGARGAMEQIPSCATENDKQEVEGPPDRALIRLTTPEDGSVCTDFLVQSLIVSRLETTAHFVVFCVIHGKEAGRCCLFVTPTCHG